MPRRWDVWQSKIYSRDDAMMGKFGIKIFPDIDIRDLIEEHRMQVSDARKLKAPSPRGTRRR